VDDTELLEKAQPARVRMVESRKKSRKMPPP